MDNKDEENSNIYVSDIESYICNKYEERLKRLNNYNGIIYFLFIYYGYNYIVLDELQSTNKHIIIVSNKDLKKLNENIIHIKFDFKNMGTGQIARLLQKNFPEIIDL